MGAAAAYPTRVLAQLLGIDAQGRLGQSTPGALGISGGTGAGFPAGTVRSSSFPLAPTDAWTTIPVNGAAGITLQVTVQPESATPIPVGSRIRVQRTGAAEVQLALGANVTINGLAAGLYLRKNQSVVELFKTGPDTWDAEGDLKPNPTTDPMFDLDLVIPAFLGTQLSDISVAQATANLTAINAAGGTQSFAANTPRRTDRGWFLKGVSTDYIGRYSVTPNNWIANGSYSPTKTVQAAQGIWTPVLFGFGGGTDGIGAAVTPGDGTQAVTPGETLTFRFKVEQAPAATGQQGANLGITFMATGGGSPVTRYLQVFDFSLIASTGVAAGNQGWNPDNLNWTVRTLAVVTTGGHTTYECEISMVVPAGKTIVHPFVGGMNQTDNANHPKDMIVWGVNIERSPAFSAWTAVATATVTQAGDNGVVGGPLATHFANGGTLVFTFSDIDANATTGNALVSVGGVELFATVDSTTVRAKGGTASPRCGLGGAAGTLVLGVRQGPGSAYTVCANGGDTITVSSVLGLSGAIRILAGAGGFCRRVTGYAATISDIQLKAVTSLFREAFVNPGVMPNGAAINLSIGKGGMRLEDDFKVNSLANRNNPAVWNTGNTKIHSENYSNSWPDPTKHWLPRYIIYTIDIGPEITAAVNQGINNEYQIYLDPQSQTLQAAGLTGANIPTQIITTGNGIMRFTATLRTTWPTAVQNLVPNRRLGDYPTYTDTGVKYKYISGAATTAGMFKQKFGYFEARIKVPAFYASWPAFWGLEAMPDGQFWSETELDVIEHLGKTPTHATGSVHAGNYAYNVTQDVDVNLDVTKFHSFGALWMPGRVDYYLDGRFIYSNTSGSDFDTYEQYLLLNFAIGSSANDGVTEGWPGIPTAATDAAMPAIYDVDHVKAVQFWNNLTPAEQAAVVG